MTEVVYGAGVTTGPYLSLPSAPEGRLLLWN